MKNKDILGAIKEMQNSKRSVQDTLTDIGDIAGIIDQSLEEITQCINLFNSDSFDKSVYINARHTRSLIGNNLPSISNTLDLFSQEQNRKKVMDHLLTSTYLKEVWEVKNPSYLTNNIIILLYRTTLLETNDKLKGGKAQISSTLEEMSLLLSLNGEKTLLYESTKHWMQNWKEEGFSKELAQLQRDLELQTN